MTAQAWIALVALIATPLVFMARLLMGLADGQAEIKRALLGDPYGHDGLVKDVASMKQSQTRMESRVDEIEHRLETIEGLR